MNWKELEGKTIVSVVSDQVRADAYPPHQQPIDQEDCWTYGIEIILSDGSTVIIEGIQHDEAGGISLRRKEY